MTSYMVVYVVGSIVLGKLADKYRLKDLLTYGLFAFTTTAMSFSMTFMTPQFLAAVNGLTSSTIGFCPCV
jgi:MFS family permease